MPPFKRFMQYDGAGWAMLTAAIGTAWSPALGAPTRITRSREFDESRSSPRLASASPFPRRYPPPNLAIAIYRFRYARQAYFSDVSQTSSPRRLPVMPQVMPQGGDSKRPHWRRFFAIAFEVRRCIPRHPLASP